MPNGKLNLKGVAARITENDKRPPVTAGVCFGSRIDNGALLISRRRRP